MGPKKEPEPEPEPEPEAPQKGSGAFTLPDGSTYGADATDIFLLSPCASQAPPVQREIGWL